MVAGNNNTGRRTGLPPVLFKVVLPLLLVLLLAGFYLSGQGTDGSEGTDITLRSDIKGECVIVVEGAKERSVDSKALEKEIRSLLKEGSSVKDVSRLIAERHGIKKSDVYEMALAMQGKTK